MAMADNASIPQLPESAEIISDVRWQDADGNWQREVAFRFPLSETEPE